MDAWRARKVASATRRFTIAQAADADRRLSHSGVDGTPLIARIGMARLQRILDQIRIVEDPDDAEGGRADGRNRRHVSVWAEGGVARISGSLTLEDGQRLDQRLDQIVESLRFLGDTRPHDVLRSVALGMLDEPDSLDDLYDQVAHTDSNDTETERCAELVADTADPIP